MDRGRRRRWSWRRWTDRTNTTNRTNKRQAAQKAPVWEKSIGACADPQRAKHFLELLAATSAAPVLKKCSAEQARILAALFSGSPALSNLLATHPDWLELLSPEALKFPRRKQGLQTEAGGSLKGLLENSDYAGALTAIRRFKQREMFRIGARDLARLGTLGEILGEISDVADVCLETVWRVCHRQLNARYGRPCHQDAGERWHPTAGCVLGLGKLGGQELNYSSDVDVMFVYSEEGNVFPADDWDKIKGMNGPRAVLGSQQLPTRKDAQTNLRPRSRSDALRAEDGSRSATGMTNHQFFNRLAEAFIAEVGRMTPDGMLYRIDLRLRPEGDLGPLSRSLAGFENYYAQWGQTWERMMLIKARGVAGDKALTAEFLETIQPFRYPRSVNESVLKEVAGMKRRIETEVVKAGELERNVKLGRGGIREIEFIAQAQQLLHGGRQPFLQGAQTLGCLEKLAQYELLPDEEARLLSEAYGFLRDVEHRLQMEDNLQTHTIPASRPALQRLARLMGFARLKDFEKARQTHTDNVRRVFDRLLKGDGEEHESAGAFPRQFDGAEAEWKALLAGHGFKDVDKAFRVLREFIEGPGYVHVSPRTSELAYNLLPALLGRAKGEGRGEKAEVRGQRSEIRISDPDRVVTRLDAFISAYGARGTLFELWNSNPAIFEMLLWLFDRSEFLAELAIRTPDLVDELVTSGRLRQRKSAAETLRDLRHGLGDPDQHLWLRRYHQAELMRIGLRDLLGLADFEQHLVELSALAEACLQYALEVALLKHKLRAAPFAIIGLGKLGGAEIDYGSDLDIIFVADSKTKFPAKLAPLAIEVMDLLSRRTEQGIVFQTDARLRPDGEKGLLVNTLKAFEEYYRHRAELWEIQSLTRVRTVAGDLKVGEQFRKLAGVLTDFRQQSLPKGNGPRAVLGSQHPPTQTAAQIESGPLLHLDALRAEDGSRSGGVQRHRLAAFTPDWKRKIHAMRLRIEKERTPRGKDDLAIKTGAGGLMDAEFIAQTLCLENGWQEPNTLRALERGRDTGELPAADKLMKNYRELRRVEGILRRWSYEGETMLPEDPAPYYRVSVRCGFETPDAFREAIAQCRCTIREVYTEVF